jgi:hypothetical protein
MRTTVLALAFITLASGTLGAQARNGQARGQGIPPGQMPPAGACRVWYDNVPPGRQPRPTNCRDAEQVAARSRSARVIYGSGTVPRTNGGWWGNQNGRGPGFSRVAYDNGYEDGLSKGREDARDRDGYDPTRHRDYRNATRGYDDDYGSRDQYRNVYRDGFRAGYDVAYRNTRNDTIDQRNARVRRWPF